MYMVGRVSPDNLTGFRHDLYMDGLRPSAAAPWGGVNPGGLQFVKPGVGCTRALHIYRTAYS